MSFLLAPQGFVMEALDRFQTFRAGYLYYVFPFFVAFEYVNRARFQLFDDMPMLIYFPHDNKYIYQIWYVNSERLDLLRLLAGITNVIIRCHRH